MMGNLISYLYYFVSKLDNRVDISKSKMLMRVPIGGAEFPKVFQRIHPLNDHVYTNSVQAFYPNSIKSTIS
ncbi:hypothetical protein [Clostridium sp. CF012]|uniref:hypothetical protein n=1 Tax=Clostridium sp. CF012 TaxID=2843319 RepID=UPI001C0BA9C9|nr:hypothetical protein [Clostridium sp. CF012]MBU3142721.1 hypothetical protein [Clostridium sp. CF012]